MNSFGWQAGRHRKHALVVWSHIPMDRFFSASMKTKEIIQCEFRFRAANPITPEVIINIAWQTSRHKGKKKKKFEKEMKKYIYIGELKNLYNFMVYRRDSELIKVQRITEDMMVLPNELTGIPYTYFSLVVEMSHIQRTWKMSKSKIAIQLRNIIEND